MTKSESDTDGPESGRPQPAEDGPPPELVERFRQFEARVDEAVRLVGELKQQKRELEYRLAEAARTRAEAVRRIDALLDKIDSLL